MTLQQPSVVLLRFHYASFGLLDFRFVMILLTTDPYIKACGLDCAFTAYHYDGSSAWNSELESNKMSF